MNQIHDFRRSSNTETLPLVLWTSRPVGDMFACHSSRVKRASCKLPRSRLTAAWQQRSMQSSLLHGTACGQTSQTATGPCCLFLTRRREEVQHASTKSTGTKERQRLSMSIGPHAPRAREHDRAVTVTRGDGWTAATRIGHRATRRPAGGFCIIQLDDRRSALGSFGQPGEWVGLSFLSFW